MLFFFVISFWCSCFIVYSSCDLLFCSIYFVLCYEQIYHIVRDICEKYQSPDETFPKPIGEWKLVSRLVFFANTPHNMIYLFNYAEYFLEHWPFGSGNFSSLDWYFSQIPIPNMIYLYKIRRRIHINVYPLMLNSMTNHLVVEKKNY